MVSGVFFDVQRVSEMTQMLMNLLNGADLAHQGHIVTIYTEISQKSLGIKCIPQIWQPVSVRLMGFYFRSYRELKNIFLYIADMAEQIPSAVFGKTDKSKLRFLFLFKFNLFS